jgi:mycothione reductase
MLKHVANHEARVVGYNLLHPDAPMDADHRFVPHAVFASPQVAAVGLTEEEAIAAGIDVMTTSRPYGDTAYGWAMEDEWGFCKLIADRTTRRLVGAHLIGPYSSMLVQQLIQGMSFGQTIDEMAYGQYYVHPALSEVVENALLAFPGV